MNSVCFAFILFAGLSNIAQADHSTAHARSAVFDGARHDVMSLLRRRKLREFEEGNHMTQVKLESYWFKLSLWLIWHLCTN